LVDAQRQSGASAPPPSAPTDAELDDFEKAKALMARTKTSPAPTDADLDDFEKAMKKLRNEGLK
jgi:hypothetical protein